MVDGFDVVAVGIAQEDGVVARVVLGEDPRRVEHLGAVRHRRLVHRVHRRAVGGRERDVQLLLDGAARGEPEAGVAAARGQADHLRGTGRAGGDPDGHRHAERGEGGGVEGDGGLDVAAGETEVVEHGRDPRGDPRHR